MDIVPEWVGKHVDIISSDSQSELIVYPCIVYTCFGICPSSVHNVQTSTLKQRFAVSWASLIFQKRFPDAVSSKDRPCIVSKQSPLNIYGNNFF